MRKANPLWGAPRIHGELLKLGINISQATVGRWMPWRPKVPSPTWWSFLRNHLPESWRAVRHRRHLGELERAGFGRMDSKLDAGAFEHFSSARRWRRHAPFTNR
jgi:hypothetical protein